MNQNIYSSFLIPIMHKHCIAVSGRRIINLNTIKARGPKQYAPAIRMHQRGKGAHHADAAENSKTTGEIQVFPRRLTPNNFNSSQSSFSANQLLMGTPLFIW
jgi:hypothetical protein